MALVTQAVSIILIGLFSLLLALGSIQLWQVLVLVFATSAGTSFGLPARQALLPQLVERREIPSAVALFTAAMQTSLTYSSFLAGWSLGTLGIAATFALSGIGNASLFLALLFIRPRGAAAPDSGQPGMLPQIREGFRYAQHNHTVLSILIIIFTLSALGLSTVANLTPNWMFQVMDVSPTTWGLLATMWGVGSLVAAYGFSAYLRQSGLSGRLFLGAALVFSVMLIVWGLNRSVPGLGVVEFTMGGSYSVVLITGAAIIQTQVPDEIRGRVMSLFNLNQALSMVSGIAVGGFAQGVGITTAWPLLGIALTVAVIAGAIALPRLRQGTR
ncbi:MAG: MFS transporter, partial [Dehalococcoidia bacterium]